MFLAIVSGAISGLLGITGINGFVFYLFTTLLVSFLIYARLGFNIEVFPNFSRCTQKLQPYFASRWSFAFDGLGQGIMVMQLFASSNFFIFY